MGSTVRVDVGMRNISRNLSPLRQKGAAAIEFALVFVIFFAVFYGVVTYSLPLLMMQSFNAAASEAVRQSVAIKPGVDGYNNLVISQSKAAVASQLTWIPSSFGFNAATHASVTFNGKLLKVSINYPSTNLTSVMPILKLPIIGNVPNLPTNLSAEASLQLAP